MFLNDLSNLRTPYCPDEICPQKLAIIVLKSQCAGIKDLFRICRFYSEISILIFHSSDLRPKFRFCKLKVADALKKARFPR